MLNLIEILQMFQYNVRESGYKSAVTSLREGPISEELADMIMECFNRKGDVVDSDGKVLKNVDLDS